MANWLTTIKVGDLHEQVEDESLTLQEAAGILADRLEQSPYREEDEILDAVMDLRTVEDEYDYDDILERLYDFGDEGHRIWFDAFCGKDEEKA